MPGKSAHAKQVAEEIQRKLGSSDGETVVWAFVEGVAAVLDGVKQMPIVGPAANVSKMVVAAVKGSGADEMLDNPYFIGNGHGEDDPSRRTAAYLTSRMGKGLAGSAASIAGAVGSVWTAVDVAGIGMHANAVGTTAAHLGVLAEMYRKSRKGGTIAEWLELVVKMKSLKLTARTASLVGAAVPIPAAGITTGLIAAAVAMGAKLTLSKACVATSLELHWRAKQEQFMSGTVLGKGTGGAVGPASRIVWELFKKRGVTRILGQYEVAGIISEPAGWMAINDKLLLI
jgi:hypothetical protein